MSRSSEVVPGSAVYQVTLRQVRDLRVASGLGAQQRDGSPAVRGVESRTVDPATRDRHDRDGFGGERSPVAVEQQNA
ncbi:hypothetical protein ACFY3J_06685 [Streptomyces sp. NPDC001231]|uniref:hypothetical protein n=1 Tax=Streptomyces sp. NPDC001231 TaxID=3364549 RepID=UPI0036B9A8C7